MVDAVSYSDARRYVGHRAAIYAAYLTSEEHWGAMFDEAARRRLFYRCVSNSKKAMAADFSADQDA